MATTKRIGTSAALWLSVAAAIASPAAAKFDLNSSRPAPLRDSGVTSPAARPNVAKPVNGSYPSGNVSPASVRVTAPRVGFAWADAGIGAAGGFALTMIGLGGALVASGRHPRSTRPPQRASRRPYEP